MKRKPVDCPVVRTMDVISGRWKMTILWHLFEGTQRFSDLQRMLSKKTREGVTPKMLTQELRHMEQNGIVERKIYPQVPPKVEYSLTPLGESLRPVMQAMQVWGEEH